MHPLNRYLHNKPDFAVLASKYPSFAPYVVIDAQGQAHIDFQNADALRALTACLLKEDWGYDVELSSERLCPTIANRLDYLLHVLDLEPFLPSRSDGAVQRRLKVLDIGTGHIAIYPLLLHRLRPEAEIVGTELDEVSFHHAVKMRQANNIAYTDISLLRPNPSKPILFPIFEGSQSVSTTAQSEVGRTFNGSSANDAEGQVPRCGTWDIVVCNPPFFASEVEMKEGQDAKVGGVPAAPTAAANELITKGGEVAFVGQMIDESIQLGEACAYYTSLIGKYGSLQPLVDQLRRSKIDNYFIKIVRQARTTRWILGWSFGSRRLPDNFIRPDAYMPGTSFARLLPPLNSFTHTPDPPMSVDELRQRVVDVLASVQLADGDGRGTSAFDIAPQTVTWARAARRQAARSAAPSDGAIEGEEGNVPALLRATLSVEDAVSATIHAETVGNAQDAADATGSAVSSVRLVWHEGRDRAMVESLWKFILTKAQLVGHGDRR